MLVYGDREEQADPGLWARQINRRIEAAASAQGLKRHALLVAALVETGQLLQGIADAAFEPQQCDRRTAATDRLSAFLLEIGHAICRSWDSNLGVAAHLRPLPAAPDWPRDVAIKSPEGFAFYGVYPEAFIEAARRLELSAPARVVGIRSIGTSLGAVVAAALDAPPPVTVRPFGDPSARKVALDESLERQLLDGSAHYVIVDEGPGQSGSSFAAVADWLRARGVDEARIALIPSHAGSPGAAATQEGRRWWRTVQRQAGDFGERWPAIIADWCASLLGPLDGPPVDLSAGNWRRIHYSSGQEWPAVVPAWERRKFLVRAGGEPFLVKFAGLGSIGEQKLAIARALFSERLVPEPVGLVHGFIVERWCEDAAPLGACDAPLAEVGRYIGTRARLLPATSASGAGIGDLLDMVRRNAALEFGEEMPAALGSWDARAAQLARRVVRVRTDSRLDRHEWLRAPGGALIKTDALDHHQAHDVIGCQDVVWDVAGAIVEFELDQAQSERLVEAVEEAARRSVDRALLDFYRIAYLAFRMGQARLGATMLCDPAEQARISRRGDRYAAELQHLLESSRGATRPESLVG